MRLAWILALALPPLAAQAPKIDCRLELPPQTSVTLADNTTPIATTGHDLRPLPKNAGVAFPKPSSRIDVGPDPALGVDSNASFAVHLRLRTDASGFCTALMCREGEAVNYSLVLGRTPGTIAFEVWSWGRDRAISTTRIDDGKWHDVLGAYDARTRQIAIAIDGQVERVVRVSTRFAKTAKPMLRLGNNIGAHQPFSGAIAVAKVAPKLPAFLAEHLALARRASVFLPGSADGMFEAWLVEQRRPKPPVARNAAEWRSKAADTRWRLQRALGLLPPPYAPSDISLDEATNFAKFSPELPLDIQRGGRLDRAAYTLTRVYWQTIRGYYASGYLYEPKVTTGTHPAVLCPHGHFQSGNRNPVVQARCITLAKHGYFVLTIDSEHVYDDPIGLSPLSLMTWNNLRGLQLLREHPRVDPRRIGCTGASGGGQQTFYLTGLRTGLAAAAPAVMVCYFEEILLSSGVHCGCNFTPGVMGFADEPLLSACFAPRPQFFLSVTGDWTKNFPKRGYPEVRAIYRHFGAADRVSSQQWDSPHDYNIAMRNAMYAFFGTHLKHQDSPPKALEAPGQKTEKLSTLLALERRDVPRDRGAVRREFRQRLAARWRIGTDPEPYRAGLHERFGPPPRGKPPQRLRQFEWHGFQADACLIATDDNIQLPCILIQPKQAAKRLVLFADSQGKAVVLQDSRQQIEALLARSFAVAVLDVRYAGELDRAHRWREPYGKIFGRDPGILGARDLATALRSLAQDPKLSSNVDLLVRGDLGAPALYATALYGGCQRLILTDLGSTYEAVNRRPRIAGILRVGDLPLAAALLSKTVRVLAGGCPTPASYARAEPITLRVQPLDVQAVLDALH